MRNPYPNIVPDLVFPFESPYFLGKCRYPALVFARRGAIVLFAVESARQFGVGLLDAAGHVCDHAQFATLDLAARAFLGEVPCSV